MDKQPDGWEQWLLWVAFFIFVSIAIVISQNFLCNLFKLTFIAQIGFLV